MARVSPFAPRADRRLTVTLVLLGLLSTSARDAAAQSSAGPDGTRVSQEISREIARAIDAPLREMANDLRDAMRDLASDVEDHARRRRQVNAKTGTRADVVDRQTRPLTLGSSGAVDLATVGGSITVNTGPGSPTLEIVRRVQARTDADARAALTRTTFVVDDRQGRVRARADVSMTTDRSGASVEVSFVATVPVGTELHLRSTGGDIAVTGVRGDINAVTIGGAITLASVGSISLAHTVGGTIAITDAQSSGDITTNTVGGTITLTNATARRLNVDTVSGRVVATDIVARQASISTLNGALIYRGPLARDGHYDLHTHSGSIEFVPTGPVGFELEARTYSGAITIDAAMRLRSTTLARRVVTGTSGNGEAAVAITTFSGSVTVGAPRRD